jgi:DNA-directed RNA polymerase subunit alpha
MNKPQFAINAVESHDDYAKLSIEPLEQGFGHTLGNALRRTLLTSIKGAGVSQVKIDGVKHKFSSLDGMKEDIIELLLALKELRVKYEGDEPIELQLESNKPEVTAAEIKTPPEVEILNKDLVLAHLSDKKKKIKATITVESGYGYILAEERKISTLGVIPLDTSFSPVLRAKFDVRETRVGGRTDLDNLIMEIWTDGTVDPQSALEQTAATLLSYFDQIVNPVLPEVEEKEEIDPQEQETMRLTVEELDLPTRIANALRKGGYETVENLSKASQEDISKVKNLGGKSVEIVIEKLKDKGVSLNS